MAKFAPLHVALATAAVGAATAGADSSVNLESLFGRHVSPGTEMASVSESNLSTALGPRWSSWQAPTYFGAIKPATESDVQTIVASMSPGSHLSSICVGMVGATIGGGVGSMQGMHGMVEDSLESVRMVTASGNMVTASEKENPDLFWAVRGAGANFGIITSAVYKMHEQTANGKAVLAEYTFPAAKNRSVWELLKTYDDYMPRPLALFPEIGYNRTTNEPIVIYVVLYFGTLDEAKPHMHKAAALGPSSSAVLETTAPGVYNMLSKGVCDNGNYQNEYTIGIKRTDIATMEDVFADMSAFYEAYPAYNGKTIYQRYGNEVALQTPNWKTSYPWRDIKTFLLHENVYTDPSLDSVVSELSNRIRSKLQATSGYDTPHVYVNYNHGDEAASAWWGAANLRRLQALKAKWDPHSLFGKGAPITPKAC